MLEAMLDFLALCPSLADMDGEVDYSEMEAGWTLYDGGEELEQVYWDGTRRKKHSYSLEVRANSGSSGQRIQNAQRMKAIGDWLLEQSELEQFPELGEGRIPLCIQCQSGALGVMDPDGISGTYHLQLYLIYEERGASLGS